MIEEEEHTLQQYHEQTEQLSILIEEMLQEAGVNIGTDPFQTVEAWLGLDDTYTGTTFEDASYPFPEEVYLLASKIFQAAWKVNGNDNRKLSQTVDSPKQMSLEIMFPAVRATRWLRYWMELNIPIRRGEKNGNNETVDDDNDHYGQDNKSADNSDGSKNRYDQSLMEILIDNDEEEDCVLLQALYQHVQQLPVLQFQIHAYTKSIRDSGGGSSDNIRGRLEQYELAAAVSSRLAGEWQDHVDRLEVILGESYRVASSQVRRFCRRLLGQVWADFCYQATVATGGLRQENTRAASIKITLRVLYRILMGMKEGASTEQSVEGMMKAEGGVLKSHERLLFRQLVPLHKPDALVLWRDQTALLELYHEPLTQCMAIILQKKPTLIPEVLVALLQPEIFPAAGNTPKQVLLLHEMDAYIGLLPEDLIKSIDCSVSGTGDWLSRVISTIARCMSSEHSRVAERALEIVRNKHFELLLKQSLESTSLPILLSALVRTTAELSWNPTVRKMTYQVLKTLQNLDPDAFERVSNRIFSHGATHLPTKSSTATITTTTSMVKGRGATLGDQKATTVTNSTRIRIDDNSGGVVVPSDLSLKSAMGQWRPPTKSSASSRRSLGSMPPPTARLPKSRVNPPATCTGVAPWAIKPAGTSSSQKLGKGPPFLGSAAPWSATAVNNSHLGARPTTTQASKPPRKQLPSLPKTGVASKEPPPLGQKRRAQEALLPQELSGNGSSINGFSDKDIGGFVEERLNEDKNVARTRGIELVLAYMSKLKPEEEDQMHGSSTWSRAQMAETPTLLPHLKFHGLVFGHDLGAGAFGKVKYARLIDRDKTRSHWAEYAVKVVSTEKIVQMGYEASIQREIAVLRVLSHPGIARLVSSFRFNEGAYLVLEYASGGDLFNLLQKNGSFNHESTRFIIGEVVAALASIHDMGLVYSDLKPENIVITEPGHIKLTDFGACRPVTQQAKKLIRSISQDLLKNLRDGDWKVSPKVVDNEDMLDGYTCIDKDSNTEGKDGSENENAEEEEDIRVEGTTAYLPPEVVVGAFPTTAADAWALGCVMFQCLSGRK